ncbi:MAG TPA: MtrAB system histidine kinase MtrB [Corynebacterium sp.]|nr:MtrAB system histidine kinase MtrB [Corynebacterium sp.]
MADAWRTSLQVRVIGSIFIASGVVMLILGFALATVVTSRLTDAKIDLANTEIDRARGAVEQQIDATGSTSSLQARMNSAHAALTQLSYQSSSESSVYEPVLVVSTPDGSVTAAPEGYRVPESLRRFVAGEQIAYQFTETERADGSTYNALFLGTPTQTDIPGLQLYLVFSMESEETTLAMMRGMLAAAGVVVVVLLVAIAWLATQQVTAPVRSASRIAQRLAAGHLRERMVVEGEDEMARLAISFNDMAEKLSDQITQLEEYGNLQRQFTSDVSHELRTPLTTVRMAADMIAADSEDFEPHTQRATQLMMRELDRFEDLLTELLEISRHDAGVADLSATRLDIRTCVSSAWDATKHLAEELDVEVVFSEPEEPVWVTADSRRIERIMRNLIANAIDHSEGNPVEVTLAANEEAVAITVTDHGVGLKPGQEELIFNRFWRADASRKRHSGGTGLGLAIAREDAVLHGGRLDAIGTFGIGSQFRFAFPREQDEAPFDPSQAPLPLVAPGTDSEEDEDLMLAAAPDPVEPEELEEQR